MFFYRAWAGNGDKYPVSAIYGPDIFVTPFYTYRWGYAALLILTLIVGLILNLVFLASFFVNISKQKLMPHILFLCLSIRDLLVALVLIPISVDWFVVNVGFFEGNEILCRFAAFLDYFLAAEYCFLLVSLGIVLYTRKYPKLEDRIYGLELDEYDPMEAAAMADPYTGSYHSQSGHAQMSMQQQSAIRNPYVRSNSQNGNGRSSRHNSVPRDSPPIIKSFQSANGNGRIQQQQQQQRPPSSQSRRSVAGSDTGYRRPGSRGFQPQRPVLLNSSAGNGSVLAGGVRRPGSVTGSIEGRLAGGGGRVRQLQQQQQQQQQRFITSSPLREEDEEGSPDLWDELSMEYPGKQSPDDDDWGYLNNSDDPRNYDEPRYHTWHYWVMAITWCLALAIGIPAAMYVEYQPLVTTTTNVDRARSLKKARPGCFMPADPFKNPYGHTVDDPGFNFTVSCLVIMFLLPAILLVLSIFMICCNKLTDNIKFRRYVKILTVLTVVFLISRGPIDVLQLKGIVEAAMGFKQLNLLPYQLEYEILLVWTTYLPLILNPIIYFSFCSEYREGGIRAIRALCGCPLPSAEEQALAEKYMEVEIMSSRSNASKTQKSNIL